jgi:hypothetical protein
VVVTERGIVSSAGGACGGRAGSCVEALKPTVSTPGTWCGDGARPRVERRRTAVEGGRPIVERQAKPTCIEVMGRGIVSRPRSTCWSWALAVSSAGGTCGGDGRGIVSAPEAPVSGSGTGIVPSAQTYRIERQKRRAALSAPKPGAQLHAGSRSPHLAERSC